MWVLCAASFDVAVVSNILKYLKTKQKKNLTKTALVFQWNCLNGTKHAELPVGLND